MKKVLTFVLACCMVLSLASCGSNTPSSSSGSSSAGSSAASSDTGKAITIKVGHSLSEESAFQKACLEFKNEVEKETNGRITIEVYANAALGSESEMAEGLSMGTIDAALIGPSSVSKLYSKFEVFNLPYLFENTDHADAVLLGDIGKQFADEIYSTSGVKVLSFWESGFRYYTNNKKEVVNPEDMAGLLIRIPSSEVQAATLEALGASSTNMAIGEVYMACSNGTIDGEESPVDTIVSNNFNEVQKYMVLDGHVYGSMGFMMNGALFNSLSADDQKTLMDCAYNAGMFERQTRRDAEQDQIQSLIDSGMTVTTDVDKAAWRKAVQSVYDKYYDVFGKDLIESIENTPY